MADTFTALTEDRPYRCAMSRPGTDQVLRGMAEHSKLDPRFVALAQDHSEELDHLRNQAQMAANDEHRRFLADCRLPESDLGPEDYCPPAAPAPPGRNA